MQMRPRRKLPPSGVIWQRSRLSGAGWWTGSINFGQQNASQRHPSRSSPQLRMRRQRPKRWRCFAASLAAEPTCFRCGGTIRNRESPDTRDWSVDALAFMDAYRQFEIPCGLERSRSGKGGHVWLFFSEPVPATDARRLGTLLLTWTMNRRPEIGFDSYDRLFPSQDARPSGGFGNLIALPLQRAARENGNSVFIDDTLTPHEDQWSFLSGLHRLSVQDVATAIAKIEADMPGGATGVRGRFESNGRRRDVHCSTPVSPGDLNIAKFQDIRHPFNPRPLRTMSGMIRYLPLGAVEKGQRTMPLSLDLPDTISGGVVATTVGAGCTRLR